LSILERFKSLMTSTTLRKSFKNPTISFSKLGHPEVIHHWEDNFIKGA
jgi:hypothetical protein